MDRKHVSIGCAAFAIFILAHSLSAAIKIPITANEVAGFWHHAKCSPSGRDTCKFYLIENYIDEMFAQANSKSRLTELLLFIYYSKGTGTMVEDFEDRIYKKIVRNPILFSDTYSAQRENVKVHLQVFIEAWDETQIANILSKLPDGEMKRDFRKKYESIIQ